jgi:hypothetical protein
VAVALELAETERAVLALAVTVAGQLRLEQPTRALVVVGKRAVAPRLALVVPVLLS